MLKTLKASTLFIYVLELGIMVSIQLSELELSSWGNGALQHGGGPHSGVLAVVQTVVVMSIVVVEVGCAH